MNVPRGLAISIFCLSWLIPASLGQSVSTFDEQVEGLIEPANAKLRNHESASGLHLLDTSISGHAVLRAIDSVHLLRAQLLAECQRWTEALDELTLAVNCRDFRGQWDQAGMAASYGLQWQKENLVRYWSTKLLCFQALGDASLCLEIRQVLKDAKKVTLPGRDPAAASAAIKLTKIKLEKLRRQTRSQLLVLQGEACFAGFDSIKALENFSRAIAEDGTLYAAYIERGTAFMDEKEPGKALRDFEAAQAIAPSNAPAYFNSIDCYRLLKRYPEAVNCCTALLGLVAKDADRTHAAAILEQRADLKSLSGDYSSAVDDLDAALLLSPMRGTFLLTKANLLERLHKYPLAIETVSQLLRTASVNDRTAGKTRRVYSAAFKLRASLFDKLNQPDQARKDRVRAAAIDSSFYDSMPFSATHETEKK